MALKKTTFTVVVLHETGKGMPNPANMSLLDIANEMNEDSFLGTMRDMKTVDVPAGSEVAEQMDVGGDGTFFEIE